MNRLTRGRFVSGIGIAGIEGVPSLFVAPRFLGLVASRELIRSLFPIVGVFGISGFRIKAVNHGFKKAHANATSVVSLPREP